VKKEIVKALRQKPRSYAWLQRHIEGFIQIDLAELVVEEVVEYCGDNHSTMYRLKEPKEIPIIPVTGL